MIVKINDQQFEINCGAGEKMGICQILSSARSFPVQNRDLVFFKHTRPRARNQNKKIARVANLAIGMRSVFE